MSQKLPFRGLKKLLLPPPSVGSAAIEAIRTRALFGAEESGITKPRGALVDFLGQVSLFEDLRRRDLTALVRVIHERDYADGEYICEEGKPGAAMFIVRRGVAEVVRRGPGGQEIPLALLERPASFEEAAAIRTGVIRWFSVRAKGPVSLLALGKSDVDALIDNFPALANKVLIRLAGIMAMRLQMLIDGEILRDSEEPDGGKP